ncbi:hypothetical protein AK88_05534 [Plasmodium fragile]|uniref:Schizont-infected cell agglutination extracellular alpha domain-containing protein n=1 Tax=Plasmodium fragile TaxID=5857 RepID=A0A0D9QCV3_PLAFR|nr:uncharacterized protein AK88_05534 [Plasmodium fragile]KJP84838.1 hypothetical protein AK88_05534 [Plasmodium fragile]
MRGMCDAWVDPDTGDELDQANKDLCELTLIALHFKHGIDTTGVPVTGRYDNDEDKDIDLYMRCILVNIFMKKIMGMNCLEGPGGQFAFNLAKGAMGSFEDREVGNIACEEHDAGTGGDRHKGKTAKDRDLWDIMTRWFERNKLKLKDGEVGVLGEGCMVQKKARKAGKDEHVGDLKETVKKHMVEVGHDMAKQIQRILQHVNTCASKDCVKSIIEQEKQHDSVPQGPQVKGHGHSGPPRPSQGTQELQHRRKPHHHRNRQVRTDGRKHEIGKWDSWYIMLRWFERNRGTLNDGKDGVLGSDCTVKLSARDKGDGDDAVTALKQTIQDEMGAVGQEMTKRVEELKNKMQNSGGPKSIQKILVEEVSREDSSSKTRQEHGPSPAKTAETPAAPSSSSTTSSSQPGKSDSETRSPPAAVPAPAKPAPAKPVKPVDSGQAAKPVAAKPASPPSSGSGTTTASAAGGGTGGSGGQAGQGAAQAGQGKGKAGKGKDCDGELARQNKARTLYVVPPPNKDEWNKWKQVLEQFTKYMDENQENAEGFGANCDNAGWEDISSHGYKYMGQKVADVLRCRVMSVAWAFANGWSTSANATEPGVKMDTEEENMLRCEVANIFGHILKEKYCPDQEKWKRGVEYSRIAFRKMQSTGKNGFGALTGPVIDGRCTACGYKDHERSANAINLNVVDWLLYEEHILDAIQNIEAGAECNMKWADYKKKKMKHDGTGSVNEEKINEIKNKEKEIISKAKEAVDTLKTEVDKKIQAEKGKDKNSKGSGW